MENKKDYILLTAKENNQIALIDVIDSTEEIKILDSLLSLRNENNIVPLENVDYGKIAIHNPTITVDKIKQSIKLLLNNKIIINENDYFKFNEEYIVFN